MELELLTGQLDTEFNIANIPPDGTFSRVLPRVYDASNIEFRRYTEASFLQTFHGLMLKNGGLVNKVYLAVFLSGEILDKIFAQNIPDALIFLHHPMDMESSNRGFLPIEEKYFMELQRRRISVYCLHTPLDIHTSISTSRSIARALQLRDTKEYNQHSIGYAGIYGSLDHEVPFDDFINTLKVIFNLNDVHYLQRFPTVHKIGGIAGGGAEVDYMKETMALSWDTYLSVDYLNNFKTENSFRRRAEFEATKDSLSINLIECSHYTAEKLVLINEVQDYFKKLGLLTEFIDRADYWK